MSSDDDDDSNDEVTMIIEYETNDAYDPRILQNAPRFAQMHPSFVRQRVRDLLIRSNALRKERGGSEIIPEDIFAAMHLSRMVILNGKELEQ